MRLELSALILGLVLSAALVIALLHLAGILPALPAPLPPCKLIVYVTARNVTTLVTDIATKTVTVRVTERAVCSNATETIERLVTVLSNCTRAPPPPKTVTLTKTVYVTAKKQAAKCVEGVVTVRGCAYCVRGSLVSTGYTVKTVTATVFGRITTLTETVPVVATKVCPLTVAPGVYTASACFDTCRK